MNLDDLTARLKKAGVQLWVDGTSLRYRAPEGSMDRELLSGLREQKQEIIKRLESGELTILGTKLRPQNRGDRVPVSFSQKRLWFFDQLEPGNTLYNITSASEIQGPLEHHALIASVNLIVDRHEILRTTIDLENDQPVQRIHQKLEIDIPLIDLARLDEGQRLEAEQTYLQTAAEHSFSLKQGPLLQFWLLKRGENNYLFIHVWHHIVTDGWSMGLFYSELETSYSAFVLGETPNLPDLPVQYADFSVWQRRWFQGPVAERQVAYWKNQLEEFPTLHLNLDYPKPEKQTYHGGTHSFALSRELTANLKEFSRMEGVTLFMTLISAFKILLARYSGQADLLVGIPIANRNQLEIEKLIGFFVNTLAIRSDLSEEQTFRGFLQQVRKTALFAFDNQDMPFEKLIVLLNPTRDLSRPTLFQVMFTMQNTPGDSLRLPGLIVTRYPQLRQIARFEITLTIIERDEVIEAELNYNRDLFKPETIERMAGHYETLLNSILYAPEKTVDALPILTPSEFSTLTRGHQGNLGLIPPELPLFRLFEKQVEQTPDASALIQDGRSLSYRALNNHANLLAEELSQRGIRPDRIAAIYLERSIEMIIAILAIHKAGGAYLPLDPAHPRDRVRQILVDADPQVLVTSAEFQLEIGLDIPVVHVSDIRKTANFAPNPIWQGDPQNLAYVIYTTGSTGDPKGVLIEHRQISNYVHGFLGKFDLAAITSFALVQPLTVDASQTVFYPVLVTGGVLHILSRETAADAEVLAEYFQKHPIDFMKIAPSHLEALLSVVPSPALMPKQLLILGGEPLQADWVSAHLCAAPIQVYNHYGPTETTVGVTTHPITLTDGKSEGLMVPIGSAFSQILTYVLDQKMSPVPIGVTGELYIGGAAVGRGYLNQPGQTAERFLPDPFSDLPGARVYRTGDMVRWLPDMTLEYQTRSDQQVKVRGFRVEPQEIEAVLRNHPDLAQAVVVSKTDAVGRVSLVAYGTPKGNEKPTKNSIYAFIRRQLPDYMVPERFVLIDEFPRTAHGKLDRNALPEPPPGREGLDVDFIEAQSPEELALTQIWVEILRVERVGVLDDFFELGGHSLVATQVISRIRRHFGVDFPLLELFENPTIKALAARTRGFKTRSFSLDQSSSPILIFLSGLYER